MFEVPPSAVGRDLDYNTSHFSNNIYLLQYTHLLVVVT